jgi:hypothetical protein
MFMPGTESRRLLLGLTKLISGRADATAINLAFFETQSIAEVVT